MKLEFCLQCSKNPVISNFHESPSVGSRVFLVDGRTDRQADRQTYTAKLIILILRMRLKILQNGYIGDDGKSSFQQHIMGSSHDIVKWVLYGKSGKLRQAFHHVISNGAPKNVIEWQSIANPRRKCVTVHFPSNRAVRLKQNGLFFPSRMHLRSQFTSYIEFRL